MSNTNRNDARELKVDELDLISGGAGKVTFNPFSITRKIDKSSPTLYSAAS